MRCSWAFRIFDCDNSKSIDVKEFGDSVKVLIVDSIAVLFTNQKLRRGPYLVNCPSVTNNPDFILLLPPGGLEDI